ncbi:MAG: PaaX family transcriptional regulator C-terminal domain-containing protein [Vulcanimicrobiaceae bacterium]
MASIVRLLGEFGFSQPAVRQAVSRMSAQGWLRARRSAHRAFYALTPRGLDRVRAVAPRLYTPADEWDGRWRILVYSIVEARRDVRDRLRKELTLLGFAPLSPGVWLSPHAAAADLRALLASAPPDRAHFFFGEYTGPLDDRTLLQRHWDLDEIAARYEAFKRVYEQRMQRAIAHGFREEHAFAERLTLVQDFRRFLYLDPGLPGALLPPHWPGTDASRIFREYHALLSPKAQRFFERAIE